MSPPVSGPDCYQKALRYLVVAGANHQVLDEDGHADEHLYQMSMSASALASAWAQLAHVAMSYDNNFGPNANETEWDRVVARMRF